MTFSVELFLDTLFHNSLKPTKDAQTTGGIFAVRQKEDLVTEYGVRGKIVTSFAQLRDTYTQFSHFTPNTFRKFHYTNGFKQYVKGFEEKNLKQINTFVVDIDTKKYSPQEILLACLDDSIGTPTLLLESKRGYQLFFVLDTPIYLNRDGNALKVAKKIAYALKRSLQAVEADLFCNDFGFFRMPQKETTKWFDANQTFTFSALLQFAMRVEEDSKPTLHVVTGKQQLTKQAWFKELLAVRDVKGAKGQLGRNNLLFTLALCCYADRLSYDEAYELLWTQNSQFYCPLEKGEFERLLNSAYSGKYNGPQKVYVEQLQRAYTSNQAKIMFNGWYKHKKERTERVRSHLHEWEQDIIRFIESAPKQDGFVWMSQRKLCEAIGIPKSTLNKLLRQSKTILTRTYGKGKKAISGFTTKQLFQQEMIRLCLEMKNERALETTFFKLATEALLLCEPNVAKTELLTRYKYRQQPTNIVYIRNSS